MPFYNPNFRRPSTPAYSPFYVRTDVNLAPDRSKAESERGRAACLAGRPTVDDQGLGKPLFGAGRKNKETNGTTLSRSARPLMPEAEKKFWHINNNYI